MIILKDGKPFLGEPNMALYKVEEAVRLGTWTEKELADRGLQLCESFVVPEGKDPVGEPRYVEVDGTWIEERDVVDRPPPDPPLTPEERLLHYAHLTVDELKTLVKAR